MAEEKRGNEGIDFEEMASKKLKMTQEDEHPTETTIEEQPEYHHNDVESVCLDGGGDYADVIPEQPNTTLTQEEYEDPTMVQAKQKIAEIHEHIDTVVNSFTNRLSDLVNTFMSKLNDTAQERTNEMKRLMDDVEELYKRNVETSSQLEKAKLLTNQFSL
ncbi:hypothetical protein ABK040_005447 [Willaertia magna]